MIGNELLLGAPRSKGSQTTYNKDYARSSANETVIGLVFEASCVALQRSTFDPLWIPVLGRRPTAEGGERKAARGEHCQNDKDNFPFIVRPVAGGRRWGLR